jgi:hypothetical protein
LHLLSIKVSLAMFNKMFYPVIIILMITGCAENAGHTGQTEITKWKDGKTVAVSLTYDDGIRTQFSEMLPAMEHLKFPPLLDFYFNSKISQLCERGAVVVCLEWVLKHGTPTTVLSHPMSQHTKFVLAGGIKFCR